MTTEVFKKVVDLLTRATEEDKKKNYEEALKLYDEGVLHLLRLTIDETVCELAKTIAREKCTGYINRAEKIRKYLKVVKARREMDEMSDNPPTEISRNSAVEIPKLLPGTSQEYLLRPSEGEETLGESDKTNVREKCSEHRTTSEKLRKYVKAVKCGTRNGWNVFAKLCCAIIICRKKSQPSNGRNYNKKREK